MKFFNLNSRAWILIIGVSMAMVGAVLAQSGMQSPMMPRQMMMIGSEFDYLSQMVPHHEEAVVTAKQILAGSKRKQMQIFAAKIIKVQSAEIKKQKILNYAVKKKLYQVLKHVFYRIILWLLGIVWLKIL